MKRRLLQNKRPSGAVLADFIIQIKTDNIGTSLDTQFTAPLIGTYNIDWGDGIIETGLVDTQTHTYSSIGTYDVSVSGGLEKIAFANGGDKDKLLDIKQWGNIGWSPDLNQSFRGCNSLTVVTATDTPDLSSVTDLTSMFSTCTSLVSIDFSNLDVSNVQTLNGMFNSCSQLTSVGDISSWNVINVTNMDSMFRLISNLENIDISNWNTSSLLSANQMLRNNDNFDRSLANWDINQVTNFTNFMLSATGLSTSNYDATLISWASQVPNTGLSISFGGSIYTLGGAAEAARNTLINTYGWTIADGGGI